MEKTTELILNRNNKDDFEVWSKINFSLEISPLELKHWLLLTLDDRQRSPDGSSPASSDQPSKNFRDDIL